MYKEAAEQINKGLSPVTRYILAAASALAGIMMVMFAQVSDHPIFAYACAVFCLLLCVACVTQGRVRQFVGSVIGCALFALSIWYLYRQLADGGQFFSARNDPSVWNAVLFFGAFGIPGISYAINARFGWRKGELPPPGAKQP